MNYEDTDLYFLQRDVCRAFGDAEGEKIFRRASKLWAELVCTTDYQNSQTYESQLQRLVYQAGYSRKKGKKADAQTQPETAAEAEAETETVCEAAAATVDVATEAAAEALREGEPACSGG